MKLEDLMTEINKLSVQERKDGYGSLLHHVFVDFRSGFVRKEMKKIISDILHEMPPFLARDLEGFKDELFWEKALKYELIYPRLVNYFLIGVNVESMRRELISQTEG